MKLENVEFKVIPEHRIVVAQISGIRYDAIETFNYKFLPHAASGFLVNSYFCHGDQRFYMPYSLKAVARCHPDDVFDVEKGKKIALDKLIDKYHISLDKHLMNIRKAMNRCLDNMDIYFEKHKRV